MSEDFVFRGDPTCSLHASGELELPKGYRDALIKALIDKNLKEQFYFANENNKILIVDRLQNLDCTPGLIPEEKCELSDNGHLIIPKHYQKGCDLKTYHGRLAVLGCLDHFTICSSETAENEQRASEEYLIECGVTDPLQLLSPQHPK